MIRQSLSSAVLVWVPCISSVPFSSSYSFSLPEKIKKRENSGIGCVPASNHDKIKMCKSRYNGLASHTAWDPCGYQVPTVRILRHPIEINPWNWVFCGIQTPPAPEGE